MYPENYIMIGVPNRTVGQNPVKQGNIFPTRSNNLNFNVRTRRIVTAGWNEFTGQPLVTPTLSHDSFIRSGSATIDNRVVPGKWNYVAGYKGSGKGAPQNIASQNYSERNG